MERHSSTLSHSISRLLGHTDEAHLDRTERSTNVTSDYGTKEKRKSCQDESPPTSTERARSPREVDHELCVYPWMEIHSRSEHIFCFALSDQFDRRRTGIPSQEFKKVFTFKWTFGISQVSRKLCGHYLHCFFLFFLNVMNNKWVWQSVFLTGNSTEPSKSIFFGCFWPLSGSTMSSEADVSIPFSFREHKDMLPCVLTAQVFP